ncbi:hypothetical protein HMPREF0201_00099 [Cedecea davisae DSM 4568]|uniref:Uncharacterized protein n=1 Tax=Cedecea davisae DSM 4568 TaxID=566551 RepID=S3J3F2_9ENTR|nr:hypothetical protein HMPREF0201_00099 [Cedecea davisae DSM 4568]
MSQKSKRLTPHRQIGVSELRQTIIQPSLRDFQPNFCAFRGKYAQLMNKSPHHAQTLSSMRNFATKQQTVGAVFTRFKN